jgi:cell division protein FtsW
MKGKKPQYDIRLFCFVLLLVALGLIMVSSASHVIAKERFSSSFFFMQKHAIRVGLGLICIAVFMKIPFQLYRRFSIWILAGSFIMLSLIFICGRNIRGSMRWLQVFTITIQPVEIAKYSLVIFIAAWIADGKRKVTDLEKGFIPLVSIAVVMAIMVGLQPNISNAVLIVFLAVAMLFIGGCRLRHLVAFTAAAAAAAVPLLMRFSHVQERFRLVLGNEEDTLDRGWHLNQSLISLGSGFIKGCGLGRGHQKYNFLPDAHTDFIYSIIGEELGIIGTASVLLIFTFIFRRAINISKRSQSSFGYLLAMGVGMTIFTSAAINIAMTIGLLPTAGLPLPFISYGGSSLLASMSAVGILLNISSQCRKTDPSVKHGSKYSKRGNIYARKVRRRLERSERGR